MGEKNTILVTYASKHGATAEIAEKIGQVLIQAGLETTVLRVNQVDDPGSYTAIILGSAVYIGAWRREAATFLKAHATTLAEKMVWLFSSGPTGEGDPVRLLKGWQLPKNLQPIAERIAPRGITVFHGAVDPNQLNRFLRWMVTKAGGTFGDFRDWEAIEAWAKGIAEILRQEITA